MALTPPLISIVVEPKTRTDQERVRVGLVTLMASDPTIRVDGDTQSGRVTVAGIGELHLEIIVDRLSRDFHVEASVGKPHVILKETLTRSADGEGRFVRQTGGRGQYGHVKIRVHPAERGAGVAFQNEIVNGSIPERFVMSIDEGIKEALAHGVLAGHPIEDVKVELRDGSYHEVDSSPMAFKLAGAMAFQDAAKKAAPVLLEPMMRVEVHVPALYVDEVLADLVDRRGRIQSRHDLGGLEIVYAMVPLSALFGYRTDLHSLTRGLATYSMVFVRYEPRLDDPADDDRTSPLMAPRRPAPKPNDSTIALPEPDDAEPLG